MKFKDGDATFDCFSLLDAAYETPRKPREPLEQASWWNLLWRDIREKSRSLEPNLQKSILDTALASQLPERFRPSNWREALAMATDRKDGRQIADVVLLCVLEVEFNATLAAFGVNQREQLDTPGPFGHRFFKVSLETRYCAQISVWIGLIGEARNVVCANFCRDAFESFAVRQCCVLVGIAGGNPDKVKIGDAVSAHSVIDVAGGRINEAETIIRLIPYPLKGTWRKYVISFAPNRYEWLKQRQAGLKILRASGEKISQKMTQRKPNHANGIIITGESVRRDSPWKGFVDKYGDEVLAVEMEGSGFASACESKEIRWAIFRGISDYGNRKKKDASQGLAAFHAALAARSFLINQLRSRDVQF